MQPTPRPRTTQQALAQQNADAERDRRQQSAVVPAKAAAVAVPDTRTPQQAYLDEIAPPSSLVGRPVKFNGKTGKWLFGDVDEEIDPNTDFVALCDEVLIGWIRFNRKGELPTRIQGLLFDGFVMPPSSSLPDRDPSKWELGLDGEPADPWQHQMCLILQVPGTHELATFATTSPTGRRAVGNLLRHYDRMRKKDDDCYPVVRLKVSGYNHRDERVAGCTRRFSPFAARRRKHLQPSLIHRGVAIWTTKSRFERQLRRANAARPFLDRRQPWRCGTFAHYPTVASKAPPRTFLHRRCKRHRACRAVRPRREQAGSRCVRLHRLPAGRRKNTLQGYGCDA
jgi:hypothetical protein